MDPYQLLIRPLLFSLLKIDPEGGHRWVMAQLRTLAQAPEHPAHGAVRTLLNLNLTVRDDRLHQEYWGLPFANPIGLGAGFDKEGVAAPLWQHFGFGFMELGTITRHGQPGNPQPRLFRLLEDRAVLNRMGFNNPGCEAFRDHLARLYTLEKPEAQPPNSTQILWGIPLGINLGKSKITPLEEAVEDYCESFRCLRPWGNYFVVNVSSPNTPGLRNLQARAELDPLLGALQALNTGSIPLFLKIAPDLAWADLEEIIDLAQAHGLAGIIATNTTIDRQGLGLKTQVLPATGQAISQEAGGISGAPLRQRSTEVIRFIARQTQGRLPIIGVGGIFTVADAWEKITAGACLLQVYTGWIYQGPWMLKTLNLGLIHCLEREGFSHISEAIGSNH